MSKNQRDQHKKFVDEYRLAELENRNRLKNPWFRAWRDSLLLTQEILNWIDSQLREGAVKRR